MSAGELRDLGDKIKNEIGSGVILLISTIDGNVNLLAMASDDAVKAGAHAGNLIKSVAGTSAIRGCRTVAARSSVLPDPGELTRLSVRIRCCRKKVRKSAASALFLARMSSSTRTERVFSGYEFG